VRIELLKWYYEHAEDPYPCHDEKEELAMRLGITRRQVADWFANKRGRSKKQSLQLQDQLSTSSDLHSRVEVKSITFVEDSPHQPHSKRRKTGQ
jgi:transcriptional regulator with XRE-family HTH domain